MIIRNNNLNEIEVQTFRYIWNDPNESQLRKHVCFVLIYCEIDIRYRDFLKNLILTHSEEKALLLSNQILNEKMSRDDVKQIYRYVKKKFKGPKKTSVSDELNIENDLIKHPEQLPAIRKYLPRYRDGVDVVINRSLIAGVYEDYSDYNNSSNE